MVVQSSGTPYQDLVKGLAAQVDQARQSLQSARGTLNSAYSNVVTADGQLSTADSYLVQAEFDTPATDSSWLGRAASGPYSFGENAVGNAAMYVPNASQDASQAAQGLDGVAGKLGALSQELGAKGDAWKQAAALAASAQQSAAAGSGDAQSAGNQANSAGWNLSDSQTQLRFGDSNVMQVEFDGPGRDVSMYARMADNDLRTARFDLQQAANSMNGSYGAAGNGDTQAASTGQTLQQLLAELHKLEG